MLEALSRGIVGYQLAQDRLNNRKDTISVKRPAKRQMDPVGDDSMKVAGATFTIILAVTLLAWVAMRVWLRRTQKIFGIENASDLEMLESPSGWSSQGDTLGK